MSQNEARLPEDLVDPEERQPDSDQGALPSAWAEAMRTQFDDPETEEERQESAVWKAIQDEAAKRLFHRAS